MLEQGHNLKHAWRLPWKCTLGTPALFRFLIRCRSRFWLGHYIVWICIYLNHLFYCSFSYMSEVVVQLEDELVSLSQLSSKMDLNGALTHPTVLCCDSHVLLWKWHAQEYWNCQWHCILCGGMLENYEWIQMWKTIFFSFTSLSGTALVGRGTNIT